MALEFEDEFQKYVRVTEIASVLGLAFGPILGGVILHATDSYIYTFYIFAAIDLIMIFASFLLLPERVNDMKRSKNGTQVSVTKISVVSIGIIPEFDDEDDSERDRPDAVKVEVSDILRNRICFANLMACVSSNIGLFYYESIFALHAFSEL